MCEQAAVVAEALPVSERSIEEITCEILDAKHRGGEAILTIGRCLSEAKAKLSHGEWLPYLAEKVEFSESTAQRFMRLSREWSNPSALTDLGAAKALQLLALPESEREKFLAEHDVVDMTSRQLQQALKDRETAMSEKQEAEEARAKTERDMAAAKELLAAAQAGKRAAQEEAEARGSEIDELRRQLEDLKSRPTEVAVQEVTVVDQEAVDKAREAAIAEMQGKLDKAKEAGKKAEEKQKSAEAELAKLQAKLDELNAAERKTAINADADAAVFTSMLQQIVDNLNRMNGLRKKAELAGNSAVVEKMSSAFVKLADTVRGCAG